MTDARRPYRQSARAEAASRTAEAIVDAFLGHMTSHWYDDISLASVAKTAGVTVPTILRHFGSKEGVLEAIGKRFESEVRERRRMMPGDIDGAITALLSDYETAGDMMMRFLAQETRFPAVRRLTDVGRAQHRSWVRESFAPYLAGLTPEQEEWQLDGLIMSLDLYVWQVLRRDRGRTPEEVRRFMRALVDGILGSKPGS
ncbi:TetR/AcrR family transcriptional regulator [Sphingobium sp. H33]|uniref:TetR/AcrR family transcriptional regulator n=2 Tax=Sphingobium nicotianae TaxID=2782607 RepID=A0A9X1AK95_9SPHN|nr:TetR/AcrR family transcriptional regulator [Sphingobium nicotianae]